MLQDFKVIDFRCRPPLKPYSGLLNLRLSGIAKGCAEFKAWGPARRVQTTRSSPSWYQPPG
jgi:hypothetical protein